MLQNQKSDYRKITKQKAFEKLDSEKLDFPNKLDLIYYPDNDDGDSDRLAEEVLTDDGDAEEHDDVMLLLVR